MMTFGKLRLDASFDYDAAGRMVREGELTYRYGYLDKVVEVRKNGKSVATYDYTVDGQVASVRHGNEVETYAWDGLAMVGRDGRSYLNEPAVTGGNPVAAEGVAFLNDMLGSTVGACSARAALPVTIEKQNTMPKRWENGGVAHIKVEFDLIMQYHVAFKYYYKGADNIEHIGSATKTIALPTEHVVLSCSHRIPE